MIDRKQFQLDYIKRENQSGSQLGMRFTFQKGDDQLLTFIYPEPFCLEATAEDKKTSETFPLSDEGLDAAVEWLNQSYEDRKNYWTEAYESRMQI